MSIDLIQITKSNQLTDSTSEKLTNEGMIQ